ncbi:MAG: hypothetical protein AABY36_02085 [Campylobacterota bacterium]
MNITDQKLVDQTIDLVKNEKQFTLLVLKNLQEISERKLYLDYNCSSLFSFCVKILKYSEAESALRVGAMELLAQNKPVEKKIVSGELTLSGAAAIQSFFKEETKDDKKIFSPQERAVIIDEMTGMSTRDIKEKLNEKKATPKPKQYTVVLDEEAYQKFMKLSKEFGDASPSTVIKKIYQYIENHKQEKLDKIKRQAEQEKEKAHHQQSDTRYIPAAVARAVITRANGQCEHRSMDTGERCGCKDQLVFDHCWPFALGGRSELENLKLLCSRHNFRAAVKIYGAEKMNSYAKAQ